MSLLLVGASKEAQFEDRESAHAWADSQEGACFQVKKDGIRIGILRRRRPPSHTPYGEVFVPHIPAWMDGPVFSEIPE
jgi:hypothetical protein